jgi:hypothetical protein
LKIKALVEMPIKMANFLFFINQALINAIGFIAGINRNIATSAVQQNFCA